jgi:arylsulfatase A-like enzyme
MPEPAHFDDPLTHAPRHLRLIRGMKPSKNPVQMFGPTREQVRHAMAAEFGLIEMMDQGIGQILASLDRLGLAQNTIVVFTSDHGDMFGDHGLMLKATMHYQQCLRVPLLIARPGQSGKTTRHLASSLDLAQTFLDLAQVPAFADMQGVSLVPLLENPAAPVRDHVLVEEDFPLARHGSPLPLRMRTLMTERYRYSRYSSGDLELYDLETDPGELRNLAVDPDYQPLRAELGERMLDALTHIAPLSTLG